MKELLKKVEAAAREASKFMMAKDIEVKTKGDITNLCTSADLAVQEYLYKELLKILPGSGFMGEEEGLVDTAHEYVWIVDPIDGTANFSRGIPECTISIGLKRNVPGAAAEREVHPEIVLGVVYNPFHDHMFTGLKGGGAFLNGKPIHTSDRPFENGILLTAMSLYRKEYAGVCNDVIMDAYYKCNDVRRFGACAIELCYIAAGLCELFFEYRIMPWDYAASYVILTEAGGVLTARDGEPLRFDVPTLLVGANNAANHARLCEIVSRHTKPNLYD